MPAPTLALTALAYGSGTTRAFGSVSVATGDICAISSRNADSQTMPLTFSKTAGTSTISALTRLQTLNAANSSGQSLDWFSVTAGGTVTMSGTMSGVNTASFPWGASLIVATGCGGMGTSATQAFGSTETKSLTASANSAVFASLADWTAQATSTTAWTPAGQTEDVAQTDGVTRQASAGAQYSAFLAHWPDVAGGAVSYGLTAPSSTNIDVIVWEFLAGAGSAAPWVPRVRQPR